MNEKADVETFGKARYQHLPLPLSKVQFYVEIIIRNWWAYFWGLAGDQEQQGRFGEHAG
jgi:hypothetical protein